MQKYWWYTKFGNLAIEHQIAKSKTTNINGAQMNVMAIHTKNAKFKNSPIFNPTQFRTESPNLPANARYLILSLSKNSAP